MCNLVKKLGGGGGGCFFLQEGGGGSTSKGGHVSSFEKGGGGVAGSNVQATFKVCTRPGNSGAPTQPTLVNKGTGRDSTWG